LINVPANVKISYEDAAIYYDDTLLSNFRVKSQSAKCIGKQEEHAT